MIGALEMEKIFEIDLKAVGTRIRKIRKAMHMTQEGIAERTEITGQYWSMIETGRERGSITTYIQIVRALGITLDDIFYDESDRLVAKSTHYKDELLVGLSEYERTVLLRGLAQMREVLVCARDLL
jgi:transcriptional regulator with XRE-family HTH domain